MSTLPYNMPPGFMDEINGAPPAGSQLYAKMKNDLGETPNALYNQSQEKKNGMSFKDWITKQQQPGGMLNQAEKKYGAMFDQWLKGKFNLQSAGAGTGAPAPPPSAQRDAYSGNTGAPPSPDKPPMSMAAKIGIGIGIALAFGGIIGGIIYFSKRKSK